YARVSTSDQDLQLQLDALNAAGCEKIFTDKASGASRERPGLTEALTFARPGDCLVVWKLDRLGRSVKGLVDMAADLEGRGVDLRSVTDGIDTKGAAGRFFFHIMAALAEMERELIRERTQAGLVAAKKAGRVGGRKLTMTPAKIDAARLLLDSGMLPKDVAANIGVSIPTLYRHIPASGRDDIAESNN
ncbi:MAG TPA: recombinase family protein, partial [Burkholderiaceae bacterium]|nr:recombinase family protein [Burkholderiaceae bacterium]